MVRMQMMSDHLLDRVEMKIAQMHLAEKEHYVHVRYLELLSPHRHERYIQESEKNLFLMSQKSTWSLSYAKSWKTEHFRQMLISR